MKKITLVFLLATYANFAQTFGITPYAQGFSGSITDIANAGDSRLFVVQQNGSIKIVKPVGNIGAVNTTNFLTLTSSTISMNGEGGLLGLTFHPNYSVNRYFYVNYTRAADQASVIARYTASASNPDIAIASSGVVLLVIPQGTGFHNGGSIKFGPDGYLYTSIGDASIYNEDSGGVAQDINSNRGKILRIDVNSGSSYGIPPTNPFLDVLGNDEIWALGLRNPWKFSFNRLNGDLWLTDVGLATAEEINKIASPLPNTGLNFGWRCFEGNFSNNLSDCSNTSNYIAPFFSYNTGAINGCAVIGGYYYTGSLYPNFAGKYIFGDACGGKIMALTDDGTLTVSPEIPEFWITTFGEDMNGELYVTSDFGINRLVDTSLGLSEFAENGFTMSPNPANSEVSIRNISNKQLSIFSLYDLAGKLLLQQKLDALETNNININIVKSGVYVVTVEDDTGARFTSKLTIE